jgi:uncharacterized protein (TIGR03086 family)
MADFSPVELLELFQRAQAQFTDRVDAVAPDQWDDESLPGWTVADLVAHLVTEQLWVPPLLAGEPVLEGRFPEETSDLLGSDPFTGWESAADDALSAFAEDDALVRTVHLSRGPTPATDYILEMTADLTVHAWDLARATNAQDEFPNDLVGHVLEHAKRDPDSWRTGDAYAAAIPVPGCTDDLIELLALTGRNRWWRAR